MNSSCIGGAAGYIDRWILGEDHIYGYPTPKASTCHTWSMCVKNLTPAEEFNFLFTF